jgi:hypothetical protein
VGEDPEEERKGEAQDQASDDGKVEGGVFAAMDDVAGEAAEAERELAAKIEKSADEDEEAAEEQESATEFAKGVHARIVAEFALQKTQSARARKERFLAAFGMTDA